MRKRTGFGLFGMTRLVSGLVRVSGWLGLKLRARVCSVRRDFGSFADGTIGAPLAHVQEPTMSRSRRAVAYARATVRELREERPERFTRLQWFGRRERQQARNRIAPGAFAVTNDGL